jgi:hypothetical protein
MTVVLAEAAGNATGAGVQTGVINSAGALVGLVSLILVAAWIAHFYR